MEINLNGKHLAAMFVTFILGGAIGYFAKPDNECPQQIQSNQLNTIGAIRHSQPAHSGTTSNRNSYQAKTTPQNPAQKVRQQQLEKGFNKVARELNLSEKQQEDVLSVIDKNYPNQEFLSGRIEPGKILKTVEELKPLLSESQKEKLEDMVMKELMKNGIRF